MRSAGIDFPGAQLLDGIGGICNRTCRIDHIVDENRGLSFDIADDIHDFETFGFGLLLSTIATGHSRMPERDLTLDTLPKSGETTTISFINRSIFL